MVRQRTTSRVLLCANERGASRSKSHHYQAMVPMRDREAARSEARGYTRERVMANTAADVLIDVIHEWGVEVVFGLPGYGINGIMEALRKRQEEIRFIQVRHEEAAAFMACAYAKFTGRLGVCLATSGPGGLQIGRASCRGRVAGGGGA